MRLNSANCDSLGERTGLLRYFHRFEFNDRYFWDATLAPDHPSLTSLVRGLLNARRKNGAWSNTQDNAFALLALAGFEFLEAFEHADLMSRAISVYQSDKRRLQKFRKRGTPKAFSESYKDSPLTALDEEFYALREDLIALRICFIREHPQLFCEQWH